MYDLIYYLIILIIAFALTDKICFKARAFLFIFIADLTLSVIFYNTEYSNWFILYIIMFLYCFYNVIQTSKLKSDKINQNNVNIIFYKPKTIKQFILSILGLNVSSAGLIISNKLYQMRYEAKTLQELDYTNEYIYTKYIVVDTGFKASELKGDWKHNLLTQKARQRKTLYLRFNCLRSLRFVLNQIKNYEYNGEILPCFYLKKIYKNGKK